MFHSENALQTLWLRGSVIESVTYSQNTMIWILKNAYVSPENENNPAKWYRSVDYIALFLYSASPIGFALDELGWADTPVYRPQVDKPVKHMRPYLQKAIEKTAVITYHHPMEISLCNKQSRRFGIMTSIPGYFPFERFHIDLKFTSAIAEWSGYRQQLYQSVNELHTVEFHDARIEKILWDGTNMTWIVSGACITTKNTNNQHPTDMAAGLITLTFYDYSISMLLCEPENELPVHMFEQLIQNSVDTEAVIYKGCPVGTPRTTKSHRFVIRSREVFSFDISFSKAEAIWDNYVCKAWYLRDSD